MVVKAMEKVLAAARKAVEQTYTGVLIVTEHQKVTNPISKLTGYDDVVTLKGQPCKLSFERITAAVQNDSAVAITQVTKLFVRPEVKIKPGSKLTVTQTGITTDYTCSGVPAVYETHQEIILALFERWA